MRTLRSAGVIGGILLAVGLAAVSPAATPSGPQAAPEKAASGVEEAVRAVDAEFEQAVRELERRRLARLADLAAQQEGDRAEALYEAYFRRALAASLFTDAEPVAERVLKADDLDPVVSWLAHVTNILAEADREAYGESLASLADALGGGPAADGERAADGDGDAEVLPLEARLKLLDAYLQRLVVADQYAIAREAFTRVRDHTRDPAIRDRTDGIDPAALGGKDDDVLEGGPRSHPREPEADGLADRRNIQRHRHHRGLADIGDPHLEGGAVAGDDPLGLHAKVHLERGATQGEQAGEEEEDGERSRGIPELLPPQGDGKHPTEDAASSNEPAERGDAGEQPPHRAGDRLHEREPTALHGAQPTVEPRHPVAEPEPRQALPGMSSPGPTRAAPRGRAVVLGCHPRILLPRSRWGFAQLRRWAGAATSASSSSMTRVISTPVNWASSESMRRWHSTG